MALVLPANSCFGKYELYLKMVNQKETKQNTKTKRKEKKYKW